MDNQHKAKKSGKARIPDHLRRRALVSCDRCKKRRIRCSRSNGSDANEPCQSCIEVGVNCESTLPRKTRIYGSVETLSIRYRVLDALIKGLFPTKDTNDIETLYGIAESHDIKLPVFDEQTIAEEVFSHPPPPKTAPSPQASLGSADSPSVTSRESDHYHRCASLDRRPSVVLEEKLVPKPRGPSHYIGPSSSFGFVLTVRSMVAEFNAALPNIQPNDERAKIAADFAGSNWSKALEPISKDESDESSEDTILTAPMNTGRASMRRPPKPALFPGSVDSTALSDREKKTPVLSLLPSKEVSDTFVEAYFHRVHPNYLLFHRPSFQARYEAIWADPHVLLGVIEPGWICTIFMILVFGAQALEDRDMRQARQLQRHFLHLVQARMHQLISTSTLINVQALLLLQLYQHNNTERNSAFMLLGCASRMAMALGMHREGSSGGFGEMEREVRKRVWWTAYLFEQHQCVVLGRPCAIDDMEVNVGFPDEMMLDGGAAMPSGYLEQLTRLTRIMSDIRRRIYASPESSTQHGESPKIGMAMQYLRDLGSWYNNLPAALRLDRTSLIPSHNRAIALLHVFFHHTQALVTRPFLLKKVNAQLARKLGKHLLGQELDKEEMSLSHACGTFSQEAALILNQLLVTGQFDGVAWLDAYFVYHSMFIIALDFLARPWDEQDTAEDLARKKAVRDIMASVQNVKLCATFSVLTHVSKQLAEIVGILDTGDAHIKTENFHPYMGDQHLDTHPEHGQGGVGGGGVPQILGGAGGMTVVDSWFHKEPVDIPWDMKDFFGADGYVGPQTHLFGTPMTLGGTYDGLTQHASVTGGVEEGLLGTVPSHTAYTQWGAIETPFAHGQQGRTGSGSGSGIAGGMGDGTGVGRAEGGRGVGRGYI